GQTVRLSLSERISSEGIWVPTEALTQGIRGLWNSYVVVPAEADGTEFVVRSQSVEILHQEGDRAYVTGTLQPGDTVVASGTHRLVPGQLVEPKEQQSFTQN
ncbi:MAG: efflux transporter periplasmic adaptor subunit, partial [Cyanobacteria bacterium P01_D01_bin.105]